MTPKKIFIYITALYFSLAFHSCIKDELHHGIKGRVISKGTGQPYSNNYVDISYYTSSCGMGIITKCGNVGEGSTNSDGTFKITFPIKKFHLEEGQFSVRILLSGTVTPVYKVDYEELKKKRIVDIGTIELEQ